MLRLIKFPLQQLAVAVFFAYSPLPMLGGVPNASSLPEPALASSQPATVAQASSLPSVKQANLEIVNEGTLEAPALREGQYESVKVKLGNKVKIRLKADYIKADGDVTFRAENGGKLNETRRELKLQGKARNALEIDFTPDAGPGRYLIEIIHAGRSETLEFWVGEEPPTGEAGPERVFDGQ